MIPSRSATVYMSCYGKRFKVQNIASVFTSSSGAYNLIKKGLHVGGEYGIVLLKSRF